MAVGCVLAIVAGCRAPYRNVGFGPSACRLEGAVWEVTEDGVPRTGRWQTCSLSLTDDEDGLDVLARLVPVGVDGVDGRAGELILGVHLDAPELPARLPIRGPYVTRIGDDDGLFMTLLDDEDEDLGYVPRGYVTFERYELQEGAEDRSTPDRGALTFDLTGVTYLHQRRGPITLDGAVTLEGVEAGCFPDQGIHLSLKGTFEPSADNACSLPIEEDAIHVALPAESFRGGVACGGCVSLFSIEGGGANLRAVVVDECADCGPEEIRVDPESLEVLRGSSARPTNFIWSFATCERDGPIEYFFRADSDASRLAVQPRNLRQPVETIELAGPDGELVPLARDGGWHVGEGLGPGPFDTRVVDLYGHEIEDLSIELRAGESVPGGYQLPACYSDEE